MSVEWVIYKASPENFEPISDAEPFEPGFQPEDIDVMLSGEFHGPLIEFFKEAVDLQQEDYGIYGHSADVVQRFASRLAGIKRSDFAPLDVVLRETGMSVDENDKSAFYEDLSAVAEQLQQFVADASRHNYAIRVEVFG